MSDTQQIVLARVVEAFGQTTPGIRRDGADGVVFPASHPSVGDLVLRANADEIVLYFGDLTHIHLDLEESHHPGVDEADALAARTVAFIQDVLDDKVEFYGRGTSGGCRPASRVPRSWWSRVLLGWRTYRWSGPLDEAPR